MFIRRQARGDEVLQPSPLVEGGDAAHPRAGEGARPGHHALQHGVQVQVLGDAETGLAQPGQAVPQGRYLQVARVGSVQLATSIGLRMPCGTGIHRSARCGPVPVGAAGPIRAIIAFSENCDQTVIQIDLSATDPLLTML